MLEIRNLTASIDGNPILKGINLKVNKGEVHAIMGPNGSGKSTLAKVLAGHPAYEVTGGEVIYDGKNLLEMSPDVRAREGVFMAFQYPVEVPGVSNSQFLRLAYNEKQKHLGEEELDPLDRVLLRVRISGGDFPRGRAESFVERLVGDRWRSEEDPQHQNGQLVDDSHGNSLLND